MRLKRLLLALAASAVTLVLAYAAAEIYLRHSARRVDVPPYAAELRTSDLRKISDKQGIVILQMDPFTIYRNAPSQHTANFTINSDGFRGDEGMEEDPRPRIFILGGSAAFGQGADTDADTIPALLQQSITSHRLINGGVIGYTSGQELASLVTNLSNYHPAVVIAYDAWNDLFEAALNAGFGENRRGNNSVFARMEDAMVEDYRIKHSLSGGLARVFSVLAEKSLVLGRFGAALNQSAAMGHRKFRPPAADERRTLIDRAVTTYVNDVRKMAVFSEASKTMFLVVLQPELGQRMQPTENEKQMLRAMKVGDVSYGDFFPELYRQFLSAAKPQLTQAGIAWIDINESSLYQKDPQTVFVDPVHTNRRGNELAAQLVLEKLQPMLASK